MNKNKKQEHDTLGECIKGTQGNKGSLVSHKDLEKNQKCHILGTITNGSTIEMKKRQQYFAIILQADRRKYKQQENKQQNPEAQV